MARPTKYKEEYAKMAAKACDLGATDQDLADLFGVCMKTLNNWKHSHPEFSEALVIGKDVADKRVERSLYERALGYTHDSEEIKLEGGKIVRVPIKKHYPPDTTALIFWLKNRNPKDWRDKVDHDHTSSDGSMTPRVIELVGVSPEDDKED